jgi:hypothetical protein
LRKYIQSLTKITGMATKRTKAEIQKDIDIAQIKRDNAVDKMGEGIASYNRNKDTKKANTAIDDFKEAELKLQILEAELKNAKE